MSSYTTQCQQSPHCLKSRQNSASEIPKFKKPSCQVVTDVNAKIDEEDSHQSTQEKTSILTKRPSTFLQGWKTARGTSYEILKVDDSETNDLVKPSTTNTNSSTSSPFPFTSFVSPGLMLMIVNSFFVSSMSYGVKYLTKLPTPYPTFELVFVRSAVVFFCAISLLVCFRGLTLKQAVLGPEGYRKWLAARGLCGFVATSSFYLSIRHLGLGEATVLSFTSPIFVGILAKVFLKEKWEKIDALAAFISLFGVIIIARPGLFGLDTLDAAVPTQETPNPKRYMSLSAGLLSSVLAACVVIILRKLKTVDPIQTVATFSLFSAVLSFFGSLVYSGHMNVLSVIPSTSMELFMLIPIVSLSGFVSQLCISKALQIEKATKCSTMNFLQVVFSFVLEGVFLGVIPSITDLMGSVLIVSCVLFVAIDKLRKETTQSSQTEKTQMTVTGVATANVTYQLVGTESEEVVVEKRKGSVGI
ncbi:hypothetical protein BKA69DRAFT_1034543 [Paraphysoderma sedebokerense]|nr:hypothetical protein BKA69DRAFT_1034543 [Paraphysoderma sedebokerense]